MNPDDAAKIAGQYQDSLARAKFEQETQRDKTFVLISGGALTVSFAFISSLLEHGKLVRLPWLVAAWSAWAAVLVLTVIGYTVSIANYKQVIHALSRGDWGGARRTPISARFIEPLNNTVSFLAVVGFLCFGYFAIGILESISNEQKQTATLEIHKATKSGGEESRMGHGEMQNSQSKPGSAAAVGTSEAEKK